MRAPHYFTLLITLSTVAVTATFTPNTAQGLTCEELFTSTDPEGARAARFETEASAIVHFLLAKREAPERGTDAFYPDYMESRIKPEVRKAIRKQNSAAWKVFLATERGVPMTTLKSLVEHLETQEGQRGFPNFKTHPEQFDFLLRNLDNPRFSRLLSWASPSAYDTYLDFRINRGRLYAQAVVLAAKSSPRTPKTDEFLLEAVNQYGETPAFKAELAKNPTAIAWLKKTIEANDEAKLVDINPAARAHIETASIELSVKKNSAEVVSMQKNVEEFVKFHSDGGDYTKIDGQLAQDFSYLVANPLFIHLFAEHPDAWSAFARANIVRPRVTARLTIAYFQRHEAWPSVNADLSLSDAFHRHKHDPIFRTELAKDPATYAVFMNWIRMQTR